MSYLTPAQVASMLSVSPKTVVRWAAQDASMPVIRLRRVIRFEQDALLRRLEHKTPRGSRTNTNLRAARKGP